MCSIQFLKKHLLIHVSKKIAVSWNSYPSVPVKVTGYSVLLSVNGGNYTESGRVNTGRYQLYSLMILQLMQNIVLWFRANLEGGTFSTSNKTCVSTKMQRPPRWINADYATVNPDSKMALSFTIDPLSKSHISVLKEKSGHLVLFRRLHNLSSVNGSVIYTDNQADIKTVNYYRLSAINNCNIPVTGIKSCFKHGTFTGKNGNDINSFMEFL